MKIWELSSLNPVMEGWPVTTMQRSEAVEISRSQLLRSPNIIRVHDSTPLFRKVMSNARDSWSLVKRSDPFLDALVGDRQALVLSKMLYPRFDQKLLLVFPISTRMAEPAPRKSVVTAPKSSLVLSSAVNSKNAGRIDLVFVPHGSSGNGKLERVRRLAIATDGLSGRPRVG
jgi:hypothetical protein